MSQGGLINSKGGSGGGNVQTLTGNSGGAVGPTGNNINLVGSGGISIAGNPGTSTLTVTAAGSVPTTFTENTGTATPAANNLNIVGTVNAAGTTPLTTTGAGSTVTISTQFSQAIASTNANNVGLAAFNSSQFTVDANGFVSTSGTGIANTITGNTGGALSPVGGNWNILGTSVPPTGVPVTTSGSGNTLNINVQRATATGSSTSATAGLASFNSSQFSVDANGFVSVSTGGSSFQLLQTQTASASSSLSFTSIGTFNKYCFIISNLVPSVNGVEIDLLYSTNGGVSYANSGYVASLDSNRPGLPYHGETVTSTSAAPLCPAISFGTASIANGEVYIVGTQFLSSTAAGITGQISSNGNLSTGCLYLPFGVLGNSAAINAFRIQPASGTMTGIISLYGIAQ